jgi:hypothetical protein
MNELMKPIQVPCLDPNKTNMINNKLGTIRQTLIVIQHLQGGLWPWNDNR